MLARLQRFIVVMAGLMALAWLSWTILRGMLATAVAGLAVILLGHAAVLAVEFTVMWRVNRSDPAPRASLRELASAWAAEVCSASRVFCWRQPFRSQRWSDQMVGHPPGSSRGVVLVHGFVCNRGLWNRWLERLTARGVPFMAVNLEPVFGSIDDYISTMDLAIQQLQASTGRPPVVVAHSMGGLAARQWWSVPGNDRRIHHLITLGTPHHGTWLARYARTANGRQMQRFSDWQRALARQEPADRYLRITSFYSHCDNIVFPASTATLTGADNRHLEAVAHVQMVDRPEPYTELLRVLVAPEK